MRRAMVGAFLLATACAPALSGGPPASPGRWEVLGGERPMKRHENGYVRAGGSFYLLGGRGERPVQAFDPATGAWATRAMPPLEMHHFQAVEHEGKIYVIGALTGRFPAETPIPHVYIYDPATDRWSQGPEIPADRRRGAAGAVLHDGEIYLVGGVQNGHIGGWVPWLDRWNPRTGAWTRLPDAPRPRDHFQTAVLDGSLYAAGGRRTSRDGNVQSNLTIAEVDRFDLRTGQWSTLPATGNLPTLRAGTATVVLDGRLLVIGGESDTQLPAHAEVEALDPRSERWYPLAPLAEGRHATQAILHGGRLYLAAGSRTRGATEIDSQEVFTPVR